MEVVTNTSLGQNFNKLVCFGVKVGEVCMSFVNQPGVLFSVNLLFRLRFPEKMWRQELAIKWDAEQKLQKMYVFP